MEFVGRRPEPVLAEGDLVMAMWDGLMGRPSRLILISGRLSCRRAGAAGLASDRLEWARNGAASL